jgi:hypothetical protein
MVPSPLPKMLKWHHADLKLPSILTCLLVSLNNLCLFTICHETIPTSIMEVEACLRSFLLEHVYALNAKMTSLSSKIKQNEIPNNVKKVASHRSSHLDECWGWREVLPLQLDHNWRESCYDQVAW